MNSIRFLPMFPEEVKTRGWKELDIIIVTGDAYVDHPSYGSALIGRLLESKGYKVGIIAQPDWQSLDDFKRLGRPRLCFAVTAGNVDSMIANYTANKKRRNDDDYSPGCQAGLRPDRASIVYTNRLKAAYKDIPIVLGGIESSLRRLAHYDYWDNKVRRSILLDSKADLLIYGMGERPVIELMDRLNNGEKIGDIRDIKGTVVVVKASELPSGTLLIPSFDECREKHGAFNQAFQMIHDNMSPHTAAAIAQKHDARYVMQLPPQLPMSSQELDESYDLKYLRRWHPSYDDKGSIKGFEMVRWSITALRGCPGDCSFCGLTMHQGRIVQSRSQRSILNEAKLFADDAGFKGTITDVGGPTANLYSSSCRRWEKGDACNAKQCLIPEKCPSLNLGYNKCLELYETLRNLPKIKHVFISSGLRYDLLLDKNATNYLSQICKYHISGQMKIAPEHTNDEILKLMNKPSYTVYELFVKKFEAINRTLPNRRYLVNYFISAHPGSRLNDAFHCALKLLSRNIRPEQIQDYLPLPMTLSSCLYYTGRHPFTGEKVHVPRNADERAMQRALLQSQNSLNHPFLIKALKLLKKETYLNRFGVRNNFKPKWKK